MLGSDVFPYKECEPAKCDTIGGQCLQYDGQNGFCYFTAPSENLCLPAGSKGTGDACGTVSACMPGVQCLEQGNSKNCYLICIDSCDTGTCTDTGFGFKVCM